MVCTTNVFISRAPYFALFQHHVSMSRKNFCHIHRVSRLYSVATHGIFEMSISSCTCTVLPIMKQCSCMQEAWTKVIISVWQLQRVYRSTCLSQMKMRQAWLSDNVSINTEHHILLYNLLLFVAIEPQ